MDAIPSNLCTLTEQLEDARQFHDRAARESAGLRCERHRQQSLAYAAMLAEIHEWESRKHRSSLRPGPGEDGGSACPDDSYAALLDRVYRIHTTVAPATQAILTPATDPAESPDSGNDRNTGDCMHC